MLVDDILDTGNTMKKVLEEVSSKCPASLKTCVFLDKPERRENNFQADWSGFNIPDEFVVGYGLDYAGRYRELPYLGTLKPAIYSQTSAMKSKSAAGNPLRQIYNWTLSLAERKFSGLWLGLLSFAEASFFSHPTGCSLNSIYVWER